MDATKQAIGIDIGGSKTAIGLVTHTGDVIQYRVFPTEAEQGFNRAIRRIVTAVREILRAADLPPGELAAVGIGCAGPVNPRTGEINNPYTLSGWNHCNIVEPLERELGVPVCLENDADAAALGEFYFGAGQGAESMVMLTFGTGIGGAAVLRGQLYRGVAGEHPEIGHVTVAAEGAACYCGRTGCLESIASGTALAAAGKKFGFGSAAEVFAAAASGQPEAARVLQTARAAVDAAIWTLVHTFLPARIVLGGGMVEAHPGFFLEPARAAIARATQIPRDYITVAIAQLGNRAGLAGAARWAMLRAQPEQKHHSEVP
ncbi:MAG: ROK family protein [Verrucomicrobia bacterium]|nr:ROK family protein [Verrucomicrobiota bacterium]